MILSSPDPATDPGFARVLFSLQMASYALEAGIIGDDRLPPLREDVAGLAAWRGHWRTAWDGVDLVGAIAWSCHDDRVDIHKLMVNPSAIRRGVASALVDHVLGCARGREVVVATGRDNTPAVSLFVKHGFRPQGDEEVATGLWITGFSRPG